MGDSFDDMEAATQVMEYEMELRWKRDKLREQYNDLPDRLLIEEILHCSSRINHVVPNMAFPAYDIALKMYNENKFSLSDKQRKAFLNVLSAFKAK